MVADSLNPSVVSNPCSNEGFHHHSQIVRLCLDVIALHHPSSVLSLAYYDPSVVTCRQGSLMFYVCLHKEEEGCPLLLCLSDVLFCFFIIFLPLDNRDAGSALIHVPDSAINALFWSPPPSNGAQSAGSLHNLTRQWPQSHPYY